MTLRFDLSQLDLPSRVYANSSFTDNGKFRKFFLIHLFHAICNHDGESTGTDKSSTGAQATADGNVAIHGDINVIGTEIGTVLLAQQLERSTQPALEVVGPLELCRVDFNISGDWYLELGRGKLVVEDVVDADLKGLRLRRGGPTGQGDDGVGGDGHGQNCVQRVVDVLADDVNSAGRSRHKGRLVAIGAGELGHEGVPSRSFGGEGGFGVNVCEGARDGDRARHFGRGKRQKMDTE